MEKILPTVPISDLRKDQSKVLVMLDTTPVVLMNRGDVAGVFVKADQWNATIDELRRLRRIMQYDQQFADMRAGNYTNLDDLLAAGNAGTNQ